MGGGSGEGTEEERGESKRREGIGEREGKDERKVRNGGR